MRLFLLAALLLSAARLSAPGSETRNLLRELPPPAHTGGFGEPTCHACHFDNPPNDAAGGITLRGVPAYFEPGERYDLTVVVQHPALRSAGFQLAARFSGGARNARQAGVLHGSETVDVTTFGSPAVLYARHPEPAYPDASCGAEHSACFRLAWTAPRDAEIAEEIVFHVSANASNDDESQFGDRIVSAELRVRGAK